MVEETEEKVAMVEAKDHPGDQAQGEMERTAPERRRGRRRDGLPEGLEKRDMEAAVVGEDVTEEYAPIAGEELRAAIEAWAEQSLKVARFITQVRVRIMMRNSSKKEKAKELDQEMARITSEHLSPAKEELNVHTQLVIDLFAQYPVVRAQVGNWLQVPSNLRGLVKKALYARKIDVREIIGRAEEIEKEREARVLENA